MVPKSRGHLATPGDVPVVITGGGRDATVTRVAARGPTHSAAPAAKSDLAPNVNRTEAEKQPALGRDHAELKTKHQCRKNI